MGDTARQSRIYRIKNGDAITELALESAGMSPVAKLTEAAIDAGVGRDLYIALGEPLGNGVVSPCTAQTTVRGFGLAR